MMYNKVVEDYFFKPRHVGTLDHSAPRTVYFSNAHYKQNLVINWSMQCDSTGKVCAMCFKSNGNPYVIAALEHLCRVTVEKQINELHWRDDELIELLAAPFNQVPALLQVQEAYKEVLNLMNKKLKGES